MELRPQIMIKDSQKASHSIQDITHIRLQRNKTEHALNLLRVQLLNGEQGWGSGESARLPPVQSGFKSQRRRHVWVEFVVGSLLCSERFFSGYSGFLLSSKTNISTFQFDQESGRRRTTLWMCYLQIVIYVIYLFIIYVTLQSFFSICTFSPEIAL